MLSGEPHEKKRIESLGDIRTFLVRLNYALNSGRVRIVFQKREKLMIKEMKDLQIDTPYIICSLVKMKIRC